MRWLKVSVVVLVLGSASASIVELNETTLLSIPPLYALDEWSECQAPGDVYCMVDAALVSQQPSPLLDFIKEYSKETLKHYNRSVIHRGVCVTRCGAMIEGSWDVAAQRCLNLTLHKYGLEAEIQSVGWCSGQELRHGVSGGAWSARALAVLCTLLVALACLATALHVLGARLGNTDGNKYLLAFSLKRNWEILTYDRSKPRTDDRMKDIACVEGIRVLGMQCVIFAHVMLIHAYSYIDNPHFIEQMYDRLGWQVVLNSPLWIQAFFSISGFLTAYATLISATRGPLSAGQCLLSLLSRWIRLTPLAVFLLWFTIAWFPRLGSGPQWAWLVEREAADCAERWWYHPLYIHNHLPTGKFCMGHTWYLAVDMQLHVVGLALAWVVARRRALAPAALGVLAAGSALAAGLVLHAHRLLPLVTAQTPEALRTLFLGSEALRLLYLPAWMNLPGYLAGVATACLLHHIQQEGLKLNRNKWFVGVFHASLMLGGLVVGCGAVFLRDGAAAAAGAAWWAGALYAALDRSLVALFFNVFLLGCFTQCTSVMRAAVSWRGWHALGRLSYAVFLVHFIVLRLLLAEHTHLPHLTVLSMVSLVITSSVVSYLAAVPLCLLVELPALQLWKALSGEGAARPRAAPLAHAHPPAQPAHPTDFKPLDLLANVMRRPNV